jgi:hypothetical protein
MSLYPFSFSTVQNEPFFFFRNYQPVVRGYLSARQGKKYSLLGCNAV